jgi:hypothetical protein
MENKQLVSLITEKVREKKELRNLDEDIIRERVLKYMDENTNAFEKILGYEKKEKAFSSKEFKKAIKELRRYFREIYGVFIEKNYLKIDKFMKKLSEDNSAENHEILLKMHKSTRERLPYYNDIYSKVFSIINIKNKKRIVDLGSGLNPLSYIYMKKYFEPGEYNAVELNAGDCGIIRKYFEIMGIKGKAFNIDLSKEENLKKIPKGDIVFIFKLLDSLETQNYNISHNLFDFLITNNYPCLVVSFPTKTLGGKNRIDIYKRKWFEKIIDTYSIKSTSFQVPNEKFYILTK